MDQIRAKRDEIYAIARRHKAEKLWVFGSCARKEERPDSDVDILVAFQDGASLFSASRLRSNLSACLAREVDVVSRRCIDDDSMFSRRARKDMIAI
ncbi:MAG: nucleotidyltransferase domain-containing protein [Kiritimatiellae bacterium]|nr:nucleotidyltransferase domain-containing protein [Kiritimatiellia bacterium]